MASTKLTSSNVAEIESKLKTFLSPMVKIEYLENCLRQMIPNDAARFCHIQLADLYTARLMYGPAARQMEAAAETAVTFKDKIKFYLKEIGLLIKINDYLTIDKAFKKALTCANTTAEKEIIKNTLKGELMAQAREYESKNKRSNAAQIYERLIQMPVTNDIEKKDLMAKVASLNAKLGRLKEAIRYEQMVKRPIESKRDPETDVRRVSFEDLGIEQL